MALRTAEKFPERITQHPRWTEDRLCTLRHRYANYQIPTRIKRCTLTIVNCWQYSYHSSDSTAVSLVEILQAVTILWLLAVLLVNTKVNSSRWKVLNVGEFWSVIKTHWVVTPHIRTFRNTREEYIITLQTAFIASMCSLRLYVFGNFVKNYRNYGRRSRYAILATSLKGDSAAYRKPSWQVEASGFTGQMRE